ncbi:MAG: hypothetical protein HC803_01135 [Saprospiraceae bacterium]|nr:hypothetical protein [Saprospiraceae bacterium]
MKFENGNCLTIKSRTTYKKWQEIIAIQRYPKSSTNDASNFITNCNNRYKMEDIKSKLFDIYNHKCAFCEQRIEILAVEHFRPKDIYFWLCYSWDNLLLACVGCNSSKSNHFEVVNQAVHIPNNINNIHGLAAQYQILEQPKFIHPEQEEVEHLLIFDIKGSVRSDDVRMKYVIEKCNLDRKKLADFRKGVHDKVERKVQELILQYKTTGKKKYLHQLQGLKQNFIDSCDKNNDSTNREEFLAFRRFIINNVWI